MPIATLKFSLPEEEYEFRSAADGLKWRAVVFEFSERLRRARKGDNSELADSLLQDLFAIAESNGLELHEV